MSSVGALVRSVVRLLNRSAEPPTRRQRNANRHGASAEPGEEQPGRFGRHATVEVDASLIRRVRMTHSPSTDGNPDPGEIVWTWVPYEERDGRGKDRPVLLVATEAGGTTLAVALTSKPHGDAADFVPIGRGNWDSQERPSWVGIERVFRVHPAGMRREAAALDEDRFSRVADAIAGRYGWR
ncbi:MAG TPA: type II toxin-antitoxin system PemK/MazF family toxin [Mycetocola sp.]|jgi:hypothetical protein|uniref:type II toxin-antitoxin system PemK/MazF family toxin n=1 Tax=Mycetocola sp. TaxID=1871042 RepID=UPI002639E958|nr:type II toxin-antitoxin system PemK/MazF family toxin [Mycetocola sp.]HEV7847739.1 type II toxin-antitoxin system PemK/MazF family toxin [Mycetocola sp.]